MPIVIDFLANVRQLLRGGQDVEETFEDVADSLDDLARDGDRATEQLERSFRDLADVSRRETKQAGDALARNMDEGTTRARRDLDELKNEAKQNAAETFSSFDGSAESFADGIQGTLGGIVSSLGPGGAVAGAIGALGLGLFLADMQKAGEASDELKQKASDLALAWIAAGDSSSTSVDTLVDNLTELATTTDGALPNLERLRDVSDRSGSSYRDLAQAYAGNVDGLRELWRAGDRRLEQLRAEADAIDTTTSAGAEAYGQLLRQTEAQEAYLGYLGQSLGVARDAAEAERNYALAGGPELEAKAALVLAINSAYDDAAGSVQDYVNAETGVLDVQAYIDSMNARAQALADYQTNLANSALSPEAKSFLNEQGAEAAAQFLAGYQGASPAQRTELNRIWTEAGRENSGEYTKSVKGALPDRIDKKPKVELQADTRDAERDLNRVANQVRYTTIVARVVDQNGRTLP